MRLSREQRHQRNVDDRHLMPHLRREADQTRALANVILDIDEPVQLPTKIHVSKPPGDPRALRGIPAIGRGVGGAINGSRPDSVTNR